MKHILTSILSLVIFFGAVPTAYASSEMNMAGMEEIKKKKKKKGKKVKGKEKGKKGSWGIFKSKWKKKKPN